MVRLALFGLAAALVIGCTDSGATFTETPLPTSITVSPVDFRGVIPCSAAGTSEPGKLGSFQVTLVDVTEGLPGDQQTFTLPSSNVIPCEEAAAFMFVVPGHRYIAQIDAFERRDLRARAPGYPQVVASSEPDGSGAAVAPTWTTTCYGSASSLAESASNEGGAGGAGGAGLVGAAGALAGNGGLGGSGTTTELGLEALLNAQLPMRGCKPLLPFLDSRIH